MLAREDSEGRAQARQFRHHNELLTSFRTVLALWQERDTEGLQSRVEAGTWAIDASSRSLSTRAFLQSFKTFAASPFLPAHHSRWTQLSFRRPARRVLDTYLTHANRIGLRCRAGSSSAGRGHSRGASPDAKLAAERYERAFTGLGFTDIHHVYEPVAAAFFFAQRLKRDATVLVADFGGGTSDFSLIRFTRAAGRLSATPLAQTGVASPGDTFDYRIIDAVVTPRLGKGTQYRSWVRSWTCRATLLRELRALEPAVES